MSNMRVFVSLILIFSISFLRYTSIRRSCHYVTVCLIVIIGAPQIYSNAHMLSHFLCFAPLKTHVGSKVHQDIHVSVHTGSVWMVTSLKTQDPMKDTNILYIYAIICSVHTREMEHHRQVLETQIHPCCLVSTAFIFRYKQCFLF